MGRGRGRASRRRHRVDKAGAFVPRHLGAIGVFITDPREGGWDCDEAQSAHRVSGKQSLAQEAVRVLGPRTLPDRGVRDRTRFGAWLDGADNTHRWTNAHGSSYKVSEEHSAYLRRRHNRIITGALEHKIDSRFSYTLDPFSRRRISSTQVQTR